LTRWLWERWWLAIGNWIQFASPNLSWREEESSSKKTQWKCWWVISVEFTVDKRVTACRYPQRHPEITHMESQHTEQSLSIQSERWRDDALGSAWLWCAADSVSYSAINKLGICNPTFTSRGVAQA
jgi:hypothetical protein